MSVNKRICKSCSKAFPLERFPSAGIKKGKFYRRRVCSTCYHRSKRHRRHFNRDWITEYKAGLSCSVCGYSKKTHPSFKVRALQFHHVNDNKLSAVSNLVHRGFGKKTIMKEIKKCQVLCARCHAELHG